MDVADVLSDGFNRSYEVAREAIADLDEDALTRRPGPDANSIAWLVWHLARVEDDHVAHVAEQRQVWLSEGWSQRFGLPLDDRDIGYGHDTFQVASVRATAELLDGYLGAVHAATLSYVSGLTEEDLDRIVDRRWDPPVTLGVRLISVVSDTLQHAGQAAYVRGLLAS